MLKRTMMGVSFLLLNFVGRSQDSAAVKAAPFAFGDFSWLNGSSRKTSPPLIESKYFTSDITFDLNYTRSNQNPIDNTVVGSTA